MEHKIGDYLIANDGTRGFIISVNTIGEELWYNVQWYEKKKDRMFIIKDYNNADISLLKRNVNKLLSGTYRLCEKRGLIG